MARRYKPKQRGWKECYICKRHYFGVRGESYACGPKCRKEASRRFPLGERPQQIQLLRSLWSVVNSDQADELSASLLVDLCSDISAPLWVQTLARHQLDRVIEWKKKGLTYVCFVSGILQRKMNEFLRLKRN